MDKDRQGTGTGTVDETVVRLEREEQELLGELRRSLIVTLMLGAFRPNGWHEQKRNGSKTPKTGVFWVLGTPNYKS